MKKSNHPPLVPLFLTEEKIQELKNEIKRIEEEVMPEARNRLAKAFEDGDIPENNPFITAHEDIQVAMKQRNDLRNLLARARLYKPHKEGKKDLIHIGSKFSIKYKDGKIAIFTLVSSEEAAPLEGRISVDSPYGTALVNKTVGDKVLIKTPKEEIEVEII